MLLQNHNTPQGLELQIVAYFLVFIFNSFQVIAPEVLNAEPYSTKADVYSFGILAWCVIVQADPFTQFDNSFGKLTFW